MPRSAAYNEQIAQVKATIAKLQNDQARYTDRAKLAKEVEQMRATLAAGPESAAALICLGDRPEDRAVAQCSNSTATA